MRSQTVNWFKTFATIITSSMKYLIKSTLFKEQI